MAELPVDPTPAYCRSLARVAKPCPPWCVGRKMVQELGEEMGLFVAFCDLTTDEKVALAKLTAAILSALRTAWCDAALHPAGVFAAGLAVPGYPMTFAATGVQADLAAVRRALSQVPELSVAAVHCDHRGADLAVVQMLGVPLKVGFTWGAAAEASVAAAAVIAQGFAAAERKAALACITTLLRQNRSIEPSTPDGLTEEAVAAMLLSIVNSYPPDDVPDPKRILLDFFLTFGFPQNFETRSLSVHFNGLANEVPKLHHAASLSVVDPADGASNLTGAVTATKLQYMTAVFGYCYHVVSEFCNETDVSKRRAQSPLSTIIGGEPFWPRVVYFARQEVEPFAAFIVSSHQRVVEGSRRQRK